MYSECLEKLQGATKLPTQFLEANENFCNAFKDSLKKLYDFVKNEEIKTVQSNALQELVTENFDLEQIWQQIELQNDSEVPRLLSVVSKLVVARSSGLLFDNKTGPVRVEGNVDKISKHDTNSDRDETKSDCEETNSDEVGDGDEKEISEEEEEEVNLEDIESSDVDETSGNSADRNTTIKSSIVDDKFFKLAEMEKFLEAEEKKMNDPDSGNDSDEDQSESEASVDLFGNGLSDDDEDDDDMKMVKYKDFFGTKGDKAQRKVASESEEEDDEHPQSSFDLRQSRVAKKIEEIEEEAVKDKSWQLKGEVTAENRPQNSLLEEIVEFDLTTRPAPVMTEQTTMRLEDIIKQRIRDKAFDSVEKKVKFVETPYEYKKKLVLEQEKSKESLAQIYEKQFLEQQSAFDKDNAEKEGEKEPELHQAINLMVKNLFVKLDALSNFHFTPKPAIPELKVVSNLAAVSMEEVAPVATSDAALLAPEEIKSKTNGDIIGKNERTATDKKRERRKKKLKQKIHSRVKQKNEHLSSSKSREKKRKIDKTNESGDSEGIKSSKAFFTQLQQQAQSHIKRKSFNQQSERDNKVSNAKRFKL